MDLYFTKPEEVVTLLGERLRKQRLFLEMSQAEVAARAGVGVNTVSNLEAGRNVSVENLVRIAMVLGRLDPLLLLNIVQKQYSEVFSSLLIYSL